MSKLKIFSLLFIFLIQPLFSEGPKIIIDDDEDDEFFEEEEKEELKISDPLQIINKPIFHFNDKFYKWVFHPVTKGYRKVTPSPLRKGVSNFFSNLGSPLRAVHNGLQGKFKRSGTELGRFVVNSTAGVGGLFEVAEPKFKLKKQKEDMGQTLGHYGLGHGPFIQIPFIGPSSLRDGFGLLFDGTLQPRYYFFPHDGWAKATTNVIYRINETGPMLDEYFELGKSAIDPYTFYRDAYIQYRNAQVKN